MNFSLARCVSIRKSVIDINWLSDRQSNLDNLNVETLKFTVSGKTNHQKIN